MVLETPAGASVFNGKIASVIHSNPTISSPSFTIPSYISIFEFFFYIKLQEHLKSLSLNILGFNNQTLGGGEIDDFLKTVTKINGLVTPIAVLWERRNMQTP